MLDDEYYLRTISQIAVNFTPEVKGKCKTVPLQAWTGPQVSRSLRPPDYLTVRTWRW